MNTAYKVVLIIGLMVLAGCGNGKIDASSRASMLSSTEKLRENLDESRRALVDKAILAILMDTLNPVEVVQYGDRSDIMVEREIFAKMKPRFHGLDEKGILDAGEEARESLRSKMVRWQEEREALLSRQEQFQQAGQLLSMVTVPTARLEVVQSPLTSMLPSEQVEVVVSIRNDSSDALDAVDIRLGVGPDYGNEAWGGGEFTQQFEPALLPGTEQSVTFGPLLLTVPDSVGTRQSNLQLAAMIEVVGLQPHGASEPILKTNWSQSDSLREAVLDAAQDIVRQMEVM